MNLRDFRHITEQTERPISQTAKASVISVKQLNEYIHMLFEKDAHLEDICISGEISNFTAHRTGHFYFSLKDQDSLVRAVMFRSYAQKVTVMPRDGMRVILRGSVSVFVRDGQYQVYVTEIMPDGIGALHIAFEETKRKLEAEGLFSQSRKKPLPRIPSCIGVITSPTGAAIQDIIRVLGRRFPCAKVLLYPATVQGESAAKELAAGVTYFNMCGQVDVILLGRGGGSMEDLWAFNNEMLARTVASSRIPIISAVGHETDFTICDFVADMRAPTPSAAAEIAVPDATALREHFFVRWGKLCRALQNTAKQKRQALQALASRPVLTKPEATLAERQMRVLTDAERLSYIYRHRLQARRASFQEIAARLQALSPLSVFSRGYCVALDTEGKNISSVQDVREGDLLHIRVTDGQIRATVNENDRTKQKGDA